jgi:hypothetical protein
VYIDAARGTRIVICDLQTLQLNSLIAFTQPRSKLCAQESHLVTDYYVPVKQKQTLTKKRTKLKRDADKTR